MPAIAAATVTPALISAIVHRRRMLTILPVRVACSMTLRSYRRRAGFRVALLFGDGSGRALMRATAG